MPGCVLRQGGVNDVAAEAAETRKLVTIFITVPNKHVFTRTRKTEKLVRTLRKSRIDICATQATRWCVAKSCDIESERDKNVVTSIHFSILVVRTFNMMLALPGESITDFAYTPVFIIVNKPFIKRLLHLVCF